MLGNIKIGGSEASNTVLSLKQDTGNYGTESADTDFYAMIMNHSMDSERSIKTDRNSIDSSEQSGRQMEKTESAEYIDRKPAPDDKRAEENRDVTAERDKSFSGSGEVTEKNTEKSAVEKGEKKQPERGEEAHEGIERILRKYGINADELAGRIADLLSGSSRGNAGDLSRMVKKSLEELLTQFKGNSGAKEGFNFSLSGEKGSSLKENSAALLEQFFDRLGNELSKLMAGKKGETRNQALSVKEIKDTFYAVIDDIKTNRNKVELRKDVRGVEPEEVKNEMKNTLNSESVSLKRREAGNEASPDFSSGKERGGNRENQNFLTGKIENLSRNNIERNDAVLKSSEFRQSLQELIDKAKISVRDSNNASFTVKLFPKDLGSVNVNLLMENGVVSGRFLVDSDEARNLLLSNLGDLKEQLAEAGIMLGEFNVNVNQGGERFSSDESESGSGRAVLPGKSEADAALSGYDYNSTVRHDGRINMII